jgi:DNA-binding transcriptional regulator YdaS (Cro superfamily)
MNQLDKAIAAAGGVGKLAQAVGVVQGAVSNWRARGGLVPAEHCTAVEQAAGGIVTRRDLRPNDWQKIWPELATEADQPTTAQAIQPDTLREGAVRRQETRRADDITLGQDRRGNDVFARAPYPMPAQEV